MNKYDESKIEIGDWVEYQVVSPVMIMRKEVGFVAKFTHNSPYLIFERDQGTTPNIKKINKEWLAQTIGSTDDTYSTSMLKKYNHNFREGA